MKDFLVSLGTVLALVGVGYIAIDQWQKIQAKRSEPIRLPSATAGEEKLITVDLPELWIPYTPGDSPTSVGESMKPKISLHLDHWLVEFPRMSMRVGNIYSSYQPDPLRLPLLPNATVVDLAIKLTPSVRATTEPVGWAIQFPKIQILA